MACTGTFEHETAHDTIGFFGWARAFVASHGIHRLVSVITDNGSNCLARIVVRTVNPIDFWVRYYNEFLPTAPALISSRKPASTIISTTS